MGAQVLRFPLLSKLQWQSTQGALDGWRVQEPLYASSWKHLRRSLWLVDDTNSALGVESPPFASQVVGAL